MVGFIEHSSLCHPFTSLSKEIRKWNMKNLAFKHVRVDTLGRRHRFTRAPKIDPKTGKPVRVVPVVSDHAVFEAIARCGGMLTTSILHEYRALKGIRSGKTGGKMTHKTATRYRLNKLSTSTNTPHKGPYLTCPDQQWKQAFELDRNKNELMYDLTKQGKEYLQDIGLVGEHLPGRSASSTHDGLKACSVASLELASLENDKYVFGHHDMVCDQHQITGSFHCPVDYTDPDTGIHYLDPDAILEPDHLGYIDNMETDQRLYFILEQDNHNEVSIPGTNAKFINRRSHLKSLLQYQYLFKKKNLTKYFGQDAGVVVLYLCTNESTQQTIMDLSKKLSYNGLGFTYVYARTVPGFRYDKFFESPPLLKSFFTDPISNARGDIARFAI